MKEVTLVITSCGRFDLLEETLDSFFECNTYPIKKIIITEDSTEGKKLERLISKYDGKNQEFRLIVNETRLGQLKSIDKAYRELILNIFSIVKMTGNFLKVDLLKSQWK